MKTCTACKVEKPTTEFHKCARWQDGLQKQCKSCHKDLNKKHYVANSTVYVARAKAQYEETQELIRFIKEEGSCGMCGETKWWRLAFHHVDSNTKEIALAKVRSLPQALKELQKCVLVCHNCHADIHYSERMGQ